MSELFGVDQTPTPSADLEATKYDSWDVVALKNKALAADAHIRRLEEEAAERRAQEMPTETLEEILTRLDQLSVKAPFSQPISPVNNTGVEQPNTSSSINKNDVAAMVAAALTENEKKSLAKQNVAIVKQKLQETWGDNFSHNLTEKSKQLGVSQDYLSSMAESYPQAFLKLVLEDNTPTRNPNTHLPPRTTVVTTTNDKAPMTKWKDFSAAMKANPRLREDVGFQKMLHETAEKLGDPFFN